MVTTVIQAITNAFDFSDKRYYLNGQEVPNFRRGEGIMSKQKEPMQKKGKGQQKRQRDPAC